MVLILSHGQATVESGFSINKDVMDARMKEMTLIARRTTKDFIINAGGIENIEISDVLLKSCRFARVWHYVLLVIIQYPSLLLSVYH